MAHEGSLESSTPSVVATSRIAHLARPRGSGSPDLALATRTPIGRLPHYVCRPQRVLVHSGLLAQLEVEDPQKRQGLQPKVSAINRRMSQDYGQVVQRLGQVGQMSAGLVFARAW